MSAGSNGLHPVANLQERQKCEAHPSKRKWCDGEEARAEARRRSREAKMEIGAYLCDSCGCYHLTKSTGGDSITLQDGKYTVGEFQSLAPDHPVFATAENPEPPIVPGDHETRVKFARRFLTDHPGIEPTTEQMCEALGGCTPGMLRKVMADLGYRNTRGRSARWVRDEEPIDVPVTPRDTPAGFEVFDRRTRSVLGVVEESTPEPDVSRETSEDLWVDVEHERIRHLAVGDLIDAYAAAGFSIRIQMGERP